MSRDLAWVDRIYRGFLKLRWWIFATIGVSISLYEIYEHRLLSNSRLTEEALLEIILEGILLPVLGGVFLSLWAHAASMRHAVLFLLHKSELRRLVDATPQIEELINSLAQFPRSIVPVIGVDLVIYEPALDRAETRASWFDEERPANTLIRWDSAGYCSACAVSQVSPGLTHCTIGEKEGFPNPSSHFCVSLHHAQNLIAMLHLHLPAGLAPTKDQSNLLNALAPDMALAIDAARTRRLLAIIDKKVDQEHRDLVQELHDNIAHGLVKMRHQLDQTIEAVELDGESTFLDSLYQFRETSEDIYLDVRTTLKKLESNSSTELYTTLQEYIQSIQNRVGYQIGHTMQGRAQPVPTQTALQIMYILREIFANIEEHSDASMVDVHLNWHNDGVLLSIVDNGHGFNPERATTNGHNGLKIIQKRAEDIQARLELNSSEGVGTKVTLWLPLWGNSA